MPTEPRRGAIVTGASRGIGKACAIALARTGYDVAITARTVRRGDVTYAPGDGSQTPLPGSLEETAEALEQHGASAHLIAMDLLDADQVDRAAAQAIDALGSVDVLVNNAIWMGGGNYERFLDADPETIDKRIVGNLTAQLAFMRPIVALMVDQGRGTVLNMTSAAGYLKPFAPPGEGGWSLSYSVSKGGFHRIAPQLAYEYGDDGLVALNVQPGRVATERVRQVGGPVASVAEHGVKPSVIGAAVAYVAEHSGDFEPDKTVQLQDLARDLGLLPAEPGR